MRTASTPPGTSSQAAPATPAGAITGCHSASRQTSSACAAATELFELGSNHQMQGYSQTEPQPMSHSTLALYCWLTLDSLQLPQPYRLPGQYCYSSRLRIASCRAASRAPLTMAALLLRLVALAIVTLHAGTAATGAVNVGETGAPCPVKSLCAPLPLLHRLP
jgi:hypothetical protein